MINIDSQVYYSVAIDGTEIHRVEIVKYTKYKDVVVRAGEEGYPPSDASYGNLVYQNLGDSLTVERNKKIGVIDNWGPLFRVSLDLIIYPTLAPVASVLSFGKRRTHTNDTNDADDIHHIPYIYVDGFREKDDYIQVDRSESGGKDDIRDGSDDLISYVLSRGAYLVVSRIDREYDYYTGRWRDYHHWIEFNKFYNIIIEQKFIMGKVEG